MPSHRVQLLYGKTTCDVSLPDEYRIHEIHKKPSNALPDPASATLAALQDPVAMRPLSQIARNARSVCILISDITRPTPNGVVLPHIMAELEAAGISRDNVTILIATGLHRPAPEAEKRIIVGDETVFSSVRIENHYANNDDQHARMRATTRGTPVLIDKRFVEADVKILIGLVEPHFMAGYSGGRKLVAPGIAHRETILTFHAPQFMEDPNARNCNLEGNPLHEDQLEIVSMVGDIFAVNVIIDEERDIVFVNAGDVIQSHLEAVDFARRICEVEISRQFSTILTSAGGFPLDKTYYQTVKGMVSPLDILKPGGNIIIVSECSERMGSENFQESQRWLAESDPQSFIRRISDPGHKTLIDQWETEKLVEPLKKGEVYLFSESLTEADWALTCVHRVRKVEQAVQDSVAQSGDPHIAVIPEGPYVIPLFKPL
ncbi:MAG: nickel-dependent lactate racemase [Desulfobacterales bacterium]|jgi:nickel-dependent lactate racemase